jgi:hypothetical protein
MTARLFALLSALTAMLAAAARVRVPLWPGWVVPLPTLIVAALALAVLALAARIALALLAGRGALPYIVIAVTWKGVRS